MKLHELFSINEGPHDPAIFKALFLAGGPGSGKDFVIQEILGNALTHGLKVVNPDIAIERMFGKRGWDLDMENPDPERKNTRNRAYKLNRMNRNNWVASRLGVIINYTGRKKSHLMDMKKDLEAIGYDTAMIYVNTARDVALHRNANYRPRKEPTGYVSTAHSEVGQAVEIYRHAFSKFIEVDNNVDFTTGDPDAVAAKQQEFAEIEKRLLRWLKEPVTDPRAQAWIEDQLDQRRR